MKKKKSLGQHFLKSSAYLRAVADAAGVKEGDVVLEIGPGGGALTRELLSRGAIVTAIEKDSRLIPILEELFVKEIAEKRLTVIEADVLYFDVAVWRNNVTTFSYKLVANIPYYITGALFKKFLSGDIQPSCLVFLVQKEVAERIARSTKESILSLSIKAYGSPAYVKTVPRGAFVPPPDVDSAILLISRISKNNFINAKHEKQFFTLVRAGFAQKRKMLKRNIERVLGVSTLEKMLNAGIEENARAEDVPVGKWLQLSSQ